MYIHLCIHVLFVCVCILHSNVRAFLTRNQYGAQSRLRATHNLR